MHLPIHGGAPIYRERVYCYELYHQLRSRWTAGSPYTLNGEVDKRGHEVLRDLGASDAIPDFLVHVPGEWEGNHAIIEVKHANANLIGIRKDMRTLAKFRTQVGYQRAIYLFYGGLPEKMIRTAAAAMPDLPLIELWLHAETGKAAEHVLTLGS